jgi:hypothetical protein
LHEGIGHDFELCTELVKFNLQGMDGGCGFFVVIPNKMTYLKIQTSAPSIGPLVPRTEISIFVLIPEIKVLFNALVTMETCGMPSTAGKVI